MKNKEIVQPDKIVLNDKIYLAIDSDIAIDKIRWLQLDPKDYTEEEIQALMKRTAQSYKYDEISDALPPHLAKNTNNLIQVKEPDTKVKQERATVMSNLYKWYQVPKVDARDDYAIEQRLNEFLRISSESGELVTVEKLALALGVTTRTLQGWKRGEGVSQARKDMINQAYELIHAFESTMAYDGNIDKTVYIFRSKNHFDMVDRKDVVVSDGSSLGDKVDLDVINAEYTDYLDND